MGDIANTGRCPSTIRLEGIPLHGGVSVRRCIRKITGKSHVVLSGTVALVRDGTPGSFSGTRHILRTLLPHANRTLHIKVANIPKTNGDDFVRSFNAVLYRRNCGITTLTISPADAVANKSVLKSGAHVRGLSERPGYFVHPSPSGKALNNIAHGDHRAVLLYRTTNCSIVLIRAIKIKRSRAAMHSVISFFVLIMLANTKSSLRNVGGKVVRLTSTVIIGGTSKSGLRQTGIARKRCRQVMRFVHPTARN